MFYPLNYEDGYSLYILMSNKIAYWADQVGDTGFEPATFPTRSGRASQLRQSPLLIDYILFVCGYLYMCYRLVFCLFFLYISILFDCFSYNSGLKFVSVLAVGNYWC